MLCRNEVSENDISLKIVQVYPETGTNQNLFCSLKSALLHTKKPNLMFGFVLDVHDVSPSMGS